VIDSGLVDLSGRVPREQEMLKGYLPRVTYHQVYSYTKKSMQTASIPYQRGGIRMKFSPRLNSLALAQVIGSTENEGTRR